MVINTNISATNSASLLEQSSAMLSQSLQRLSSGSKIINPSDDSAGLAVSMKLTSQMARVSGAQNNLSDAISFSQTQDGYLAQVNSALSRMSELTVLSQDVTKVTSDRALYNQEYTALATYINAVATKDFNGVSLFTANALSVTTSPDGSNAFSMTGVDLGGSTYTTATGDTVDTVAHAQTAEADVTKAITQLASDRATVGTNEETMTYNNNQLSTLSNNLAAANSQIMDVDVATESTTYAKYNILVQTGTAMLAQANSLPQSVLRLLS
jgi:flagellin